MKLNNFYYIFLIIFFCASCSKNISKENVINEKNLDLQVIETYKQGMDSLKRGDVLFAAKKFNETEILFPQSEWAPKAALMAAFSYYSQDYYVDAIAELERFIKVYPKHKNLDYAHYLLAISYYEQIVDEKKDLKSILSAKKIFEIVMKDFSKSEYALDAEFKLDLINDVLASKEMYLGRYYFEKKKWIPAINRFKTVINQYDTTIYAEEALHRLVEIHYVIGLKQEAKKYANLLGYNYQSSKWYEKSYIVFDKKYKKNNAKIKKEKNLLSKFKSLLD
ncbi:outer membrane protein assembly factor BamD [Candidatus Pelagibacter sp.]|nr:outer membrane protein assembly factor BamD [Candidatus Pelagibacter sp.]